MKNTSARKSTKTGFTLIEVILFLAISSAVLIAILSGTSRSLAQQRYNDSVQDLYSFLQSQYSSVINVQNVNGTGTSTDQAIYGKLIVFDKGNRSSSGGSIVDSYTVIGKVVTSAEVGNYTNTHAAFNDLNLQVVCAEKTSYSSQWGATIENTTKRDETGSGNIDATVAILRSPINGTIYTYKTDDALVATCTGDTYDFLSSVTSDKFGDSGAKFNKISNNANQALNLCIYTEDEAYGDKRRNIRISNTNSINSIRLIPLDDAGDNQCK